MSRCNRGDGYIAKCPGQAKQREEQQGRLNRAPGGREGQGEERGRSGLVNAFKISLFYRQSGTAANLLRPTM